MSDLTPDKLRAIADALYEWDQALSGQMRDLADAWEADLANAEADRKDLDITRDANKMLIDVTVDAGKRLDALGELLMERRDQASALERRLKTLERASRELVEFIVAEMGEYVLPEGHEDETWEDACVRKAHFVLGLLEDQPDE